MSFITQGKQCVKTLVRPLKNAHPPFKAEMYVRIGPDELLL
jgi:hypothetical protein